MLESHSLGVVSATFELIFLKRLNISHSFDPQIKIIEMVNIRCKSNSK